jgi:hypothetical protein
MGAKLALRSAEALRKRVSSVRSYGKETLFNERTLKYIREWEIPCTSYAASFIGHHLGAVAGETCRRKASPMPSGRTGQSSLPLSPEVPSNSGALSTLQWVAVLEVAVIPAHFWSRIILGFVLVTVIYVGNVFVSKMIFPSDDPTGDAIANSEDQKVRWPRSHTR